VRLRHAPSPPMCRSRFTATAMNKQSNRAHRIFTLVAQFKRGDQWFTTTLTLVDLAGV
jgi:hypothetical protein